MNAIAEPTLSDTVSPFERRRLRDRMIWPDEIRPPQDSWEQRYEEVHWLGVKLSQLCDKILEEVRLASTELLAEYDCHASSQAMIPAVERFRARLRAVGVLPEKGEAADGE